MNLKNILISRKVKDLLYTVTANIVSVLSGIITAFVIPMFLGIDEYANFRLFTLYVGYVGLLHLGFVDGIYIAYGKYDYDSLPKKKFKAYSLFLFIFQLNVSILIISYSYVFINDYSRKIVFIFIGINVLIMNFTSYFTFISQFVRNFRLYSITLILSKIIFIIFVLLLYKIKLSSSFYFILAQTIVNLVILLIFVFKFYDIIFGKRESIVCNIGDIRKYFKIGFMITIGNLMAILIVGLDRNFIDYFYTKKDFAMYSFAVSILSLLYLLLNAVTTVIYPYLVRENSDNYTRFYEKFETYLFILIGLGLSTFFVIEFIVNRWIPKYNGALVITYILYPTILFNGQIAIVASNFYKALGLKREYMKNNLVAFGISLIVIVIFNSIFKNVIAVAVASLVSFYLWLVYSDYFFKKKLNAKIHKIHIMQICLCLSFIFCSYKFKWFLGLIIYLIFYVVIILIFYRKDLTHIKRKLMNTIS